MLQVVGLVRDADGHPFFRDRSGDVVVTYCTAIPHFLQEVRATEPDAVVVALYHDFEPACATALTLVRQYAPAAGIFILGAPTPDDFRAMARLAAVGIDDVLFTGLDSLRRLVAVCERRGNPRSAGAHAWSLIRELTPVRAQPVVRCCVDNAGKRITAVDVAIQLGERRTAIANRLARSSCPSMQELIGWTTLVTATVMLDRRAVSVEAVALKLDLPSAAALSNLTYRYIGVRPSELRRGGLTLVLSRYAARMLRAAQGHDNRRRSPNV